MKNSTVFKLMLLTAIFIASNNVSVFAQNSPAPKQAPAKTVQPPAENKKKDDALNQSVSPKAGSGDTDDVLLDDQEMKRKAITEQGMPSTSDQPKPKPATSTTINGGNTKPKTNTKNSGTSPK